MAWWFVVPSSTRRWLSREGRAGGLLCWHLLSSWRLLLRQSRVYCIHQRERLIHCCALFSIPFYSINVYIYYVLSWHTVLLYQGIMFIIFIGCFTILWYSILFYTILYSSNSSILLFTLLYSSIVFFTILCYSILFYTSFSYTLWFCSITF